MMTSYAWPICPVAPPLPSSRWHSHRGPFSDGRAQRGRENPYRSPLVLAAQQIGCLHHLVQVLGRVVLATMIRHEHHAWTWQTLF